MELITLNPDLKKLHDHGYEVQIVYNHLLIHGVPYLTTNKQLAYGILVSTLVLAGDRTAYNEQADHTVHFVGEFPCAVDGSELTSFAKAGGRQELMSGLWTDHTFSAKPPGNYRDYHHKMTTYIKKLRAPLVELGIVADARTFRGVVDSGDESPFHFRDTNSGRAGITAINNSVAGQKIAILGVGGTGSYILDFVAKTPVAEVHLFDGDIMLSHNAFRAPASPTVEQLRQMRNKADYHASTYSSMHKGIKPHAYNLSECNLSELDDFDFVFVSMDGGADKQNVIRYLIERAIPFVDVGLNMRVQNSALRGQVRTVLVTPQNVTQQQEYIIVSSPDSDRAVYRSNAQIAEMNALNACMAVIAWKRHHGIYVNTDNSGHSVFNIHRGVLIT